MKSKLWVSLLAALAFSAVSAYAQETAPKVDVFAGYSYVQANPGVTGVDSFHLHGGNANVSYNITNWLGGVADFGGYTNGKILNNLSSGSGTFSTYLFGPRVSYRHYSRVTPFGQVLFGAAHANAAAFGTTRTQNAFAMTAGGGVDYKILDHFSIRPFQAEYLLTRFRENTLGTRNQSNFRVSTGFVVRF